MARHKSAQKRARQSEVRAARNNSIKHRVSHKIRLFREALTSGDRAKASETLACASRELQKAASKGVLHIRNAARRISRLALAFNSSAK
ncbi:MAG: 30S ribosomal protein S20 [Deltaproteobacteria bacterium]|nr:30S ribosomal protein S20 [Deltaproteobacteria bacterium]